MARIPDQEVERLKAEVSLVRLVEASGVELKKHGKDFHGRCPFHDDRTPSLVISPDKNLWHCLGACQTGGSVIDWVMRVEGISFRHAVELLREQPSSLAASPSSEPPKYGTVRKLAADDFSGADEQKLLERVVAFYHQRLKEVPAALDYLKARGLVHVELINAFRLGVADRTLSYRLPQKNRAAGAELRGQLQKLGVLRESGHEHLNGSLVIPIFDASGQLVQMYGRKLTPNLRAGTPDHLYLPRPHAGVFNAPGIAGAKEVILCEALIDALTFWCAGYRNVTSSFGINGFTDELLAHLKAGKVQRVLIAYDRDAAGDAAAEVLGKKLMSEGIEAFRILFPHGLDANAFALKVQPASKSLGVAIRGAHWLGKGAKPAIESAPHVIVSVPEPAPAPVIAAPRAVPDFSLVAAVEPPAPPPEPTKASPLPEPLPALDVPMEVRPHEILIVCGDRRWRVRGMSPEPVPGQLKANILVSRAESFHVDTLDLYCARLRTAFLKQASAELAFSEDTLKRDLGTVLLKLEALQAEAADKQAAPPAATMSNEDKACALELLRDPLLVERIAADLTRLGIIGEDINKLVSYLAAVSRKQDKPLAIVIQSTSAAGKTALMDAVLSMVPSEDRVHYSAVTGQSLFYMGELGVKHKVLAISEEEGAREAAYALKLLQSQGELTIASTGKDPVTGRLITHEYKVEGPVMLFLTTTAIEVDEELLNRCLVLSVNESREQTRAIHTLQRQRRTLAGLLERSERERITKTHQNAQRLLRALPVVNPFAERLSFIDSAPRNRRDHEKYLSLIEAVALVHQYQRLTKTVEHGGNLIEYIEVTEADITLANRLARAVLGQSLDELPPQTRRLLHLIENLVREAVEGSALKAADVRFSRRDVREHTGWGHTQLKVHLHRLEEMEFLLVHRGGRGAGYVYELLYDGKGQSGEPFLPGLIEPHEYDGNRSGVKAEKSARGRPPVGGMSGVPPTTGKPHPDSVSEESGSENRGRTTRASGAGASHRSGRLPLAASAR